MTSLSDIIDLPPTNTFNVGLTSCHEGTMLNKFGKPGELTDECSEPTGAFKALVQFGVNVGPFKLSGMHAAIDSFEAVLADAKASNPDLVNQLKTEGMLCVRHIRHNPNAFSNHSWGTAVDLFYGTTGVIPQGQRKTHRGLLLIAPFFNRQGWYWGAGFSGGAVDAMHFELANETIAKLPGLTSPEIIVAANNAGASTGPAPRPTQPPGRPDIPA